MKQSPTKRVRIHSLDALRAIMMMLGIVLHSTEIYLVQENSPWPKDPNTTSIQLEYLEYFIHLFRMPIFFIMAGFFGALLFYERGPKRMMVNRVERILYPFVVFLLILFPIVYFLLIYVRKIFAGEADAFSSTLEGFSSFLPDFTIHLWFLYYLFLITIFCFIIGLLMSRQSSLKSRINRIFHQLFGREYLKVLVLAVMVFVGLLIIWELTPATPLAWVPEIEAFLFYLFFYVFGWLLYTSKYDLQRFTKNAWPYIGLALILFFGELILQDQLSDVMMGVINAFIISLLIFGITGIFVLYGSQESKQLRYISDASYWVYLIHLPFTILIPGIIVGLPISALVKFLITMIVTTIICFSTYQLFVRKTFIGQFLNGKKYK